jgi:hypothetical protein
MADQGKSELPPEFTESLRDGSPSDAEKISTPETQGSMLDVHAPHESIRTWKSFFVHIATIVIGLLIAIALEQTVEHFHHRQQRHQLLEDLRHEAEERIKVLPANNHAHLEQENWFREILQAALSAIPAGGSVTFVVPAHLDGRGDEKPETAVWDAAKASGAVNVLSRAEIEAWERIDFVAKRADRSAEATNAASRALRATADHIGVSLKPGASVHVTLAQRDELTRDLATLIEAAHDLLREDVTSAGISNAVLHGAQTPEQIAPYIDEAFKSIPP